MVVTMTNVRLGFGDHAVEVIGVVGGQRAAAGTFLDLPVVEVHARLAQIAERDELIPLGVVAEDGVDVHSGAPAGADERVTAKR